MKIIDSHSHVFPDAIADRAVANLENHYQMKWDRTGTVEDIKDSLESGGIYKTVIFSTPTKPTQVRSINDYMKSLDGGKFIALGSVHPDYEDVRGEIKRVKEMGLHGFKFHPDFQEFNIDDDKALIMYEEIGENYPILIHTGDEHLDFSAPRRMANVMKVFPRHTFIAAHLGGYSQWEESKKHLVGKNLYLDTSSCLCKLTPKELVEIIRMHGADKILFGTDYPAADQNNELQRILSLDLTDEEKEKILSQNAIKLFNIK